MARRFLVAVLLVTLVAGLSMGVAAQEKKKVALILSGGLGDRSFLDSTYRGFQWALEQLPIEGRYVEPSGPEEYETSIRFMAQNGYDLIITVSFSMLDATEAIAEQFPNVQFAIIDSDSELPNVSGVVFKEHVGSFLAGVVAGKMTQSNTVGFVGGAHNPLIERFEKGFTMGVQAVNPEAKVLVGYAGVFNDPAKGKEVAMAHYNRGADIVYHAAGKTGEGVIEAAKEVGKYVIGVDSDQCYIAPDNMITSMLKRLDVAVFNIIKDFVEGNYVPGTMIFGLEEDAVGPCQMYPLEYDHVHFPGLDEALEAVQEYYQKLLNGEIVVPDPTGMLN